MVMKNFLVITTPLLLFLQSARPEPCNIIVDFGSSGSKLYIWKAGAGKLPTEKCGRSGCATALANGDPEHPCGTQNGTLGRKIADKLDAAGCTENNFVKVQATAGNRFKGIDNIGMFEKLYEQLSAIGTVDRNAMGVIEGTKEAEYELIASLSSGGGAGTIGVGGSSAQISIPMSIVGDAFGGAASVRMFYDNDGSPPYQGCLNDEFSCGAGTSGAFIDARPVNGTPYLLVSFLADHTQPSPMHIVGGLDEARAKLGTGRQLTDFCENNGANQPKNGGQCLDDGYNRCQAYHAATTADEAMAAMKTCLRQDAMFGEFLDVWDTVPDKDSWKPTLISQAKGVMSRGTGTFGDLASGPYTDWERNQQEQDGFRSFLRDVQSVIKELGHKQSLERRIFYANFDSLWESLFNKWCAGHPVAARDYIPKYDKCLDTGYVMGFMVSLLGEERTYAILSQQNANGGDPVDGLCVAEPQMCKAPSTSALADLERDIRALEQ